MASTDYILVKDYNGVVSWKQAGTIDYHLEKADNATYRVLSRNVNDYVGWLLPTRGSNYNLLTYDGSSIAFKKHTLTILSASAWTSGGQLENIGIDQAALLYSYGSGGSGGSYTGCTLGNCSNGGGGGGGAAYALIAPIKIRLAVAAYLGGYVSYANDTRLGTYSVTAAVVYANNGTSGSGVGASDSAQGGSGGASIIGVKSNIQHSSSDSIANSVPSYGVGGGNGGYGLGDGRDGSYTFYKVTNNYIAYDSLSASGGGGGGALVDNYTIGGNTPGFNYTLSIGAASDNISQAAKSGGRANAHSGLNRRAGGGGASPFYNGRGETSDPGAQIGNGGCGLLSPNNGGDRTSPGGGVRAAYIANVVWGFN